MNSSLLFILLVTLITLQANAQEEVPVIEIDLASKCQEEVKKIEKEQAQIIKPEMFDCEETISESVDQLAMDIGDILLPVSSETVETCSTLAENSDLELEPIKVELPSEDNEKEKKHIIVRFTNGLKTVPHNIKTKMEFSTPEGNHSIQNFVMTYDTRWQHLNPGNWDSFESAFNFLHESTWGYQIDVLVEGKDKKRSGISLFLDHPKFKGAMAQSRDADGKVKNEKVPYFHNKNHGDTEGYKQGSTVYHVQNSHMNIIGGLKLSREVWVKELKNGGRLSYGVNAGGGVNIGAPRAVETKVGTETDPGYWKETVGPAKVQGWTAMAGHAFEYEKGKVAVTLNHSLQYSKIKQDYIDGGSVKYSLPHSAVALTVSVNVFNSKNKDKKKKKKDE